MDFESSKVFGAVGALLILVGVFVSTYTFGVVVLIGLVLLFIGLNGLAGYYNEKGIFTNAIYSLVAGIVGGVAAAATLLYVVFDTTVLTSLLEKLYPSWNGSWSTITSLRGMTPNTANITSGDVAPVLGAMFLVLVILWIFLVVSAFFARRSLKTLGTKSSVSLFSTASLLLLVGAFLTIILVGLVLMWVAVLLVVIAFFQMRPPVMEVQGSVAASSPSMPTPV